VRAVLIGKLFEKIRLAARLEVGNVAPPNVRYWGCRRKTFAQFEFFRFGPDSDILRGSLRGVIWARLLSIRWLYVVMLSILRASPLNHSTGSTDKFMAGDWILPSIN
jgi:hypothetical protein